MTEIENNLKFCLKMKYLIVACVILLVNIVTGCRFSPSVWCSSPVIAKECQVESQCAQYHTHNAKPVDFAVYIESLCPDCKQFITDQLWPTWKQIGNIMNLQIIPYGNAEESKDGDQWKFECQHGPDECVGNLIETCAINILNNITTIMPFVHCIEESKDTPAHIAPQCAKQQGIDYAPIVKCAKGPMGNQLEHDMAVKTDALKPAHKYVPWVTLNGVHTEKIQTEAQDNLTKLICDTYQGTKPDACNKSTYRHSRSRF